MTREPMPKVEKYLSYLDVSSARADRKESRLVAKIRKALIECNQGNIPDSKTINCLQKIYHSACWTEKYGRIARDILEYSGY